MRASVLKLLLAVCLCLPAAYAQQQAADAEYRPSVETPAYSGAGPRIAIDEAHANFHTAAGRFRPFAELAAADGYTVVPSRQSFAEGDLAHGSLADIDVLVIANARAPASEFSAFSEAECDALRDWVRQGGSLLLIADHAPFGTAASRLAERFGVTMGQGWVFEQSAAGVETEVIFSKHNSGLGGHAILRGLHAGEGVTSVTSFTGQSLTGPASASVLLALGPHAREATTLKQALAAIAASRSDPSSQANRNSADLDAHSHSVAGRAQGLALTFGAGRLVVLGEAALFSAQIVTPAGAGPEGALKVGMNAPGNDNPRLALNVLHWLSGLLP